jgi:uncharacterized protein (DUF4415 family)
MKTKRVKKDIDLNNSLSLTPQQRAGQAVSAKRPHDKINYSDIPPLTGAFWKKAVRNPMYKPTKPVTTVRIDSDVLLWLKGRGKGYQTRINAILRETMLLCNIKDTA